MLRSWENARHLELKDELNQFWMSTVSATTCLRAISSRRMQIPFWTDQLIRFWGSKVTVASHDVNTEGFLGGILYHHINGVSFSLSLCRSEEKILN